MSDSLITNNLAIISGQITNHFRVFPGNPEKKLYTTDLTVKRLSGYVDYVPVTIHKKTACAIHNRIGQNIRVTGRFSSYNYHYAGGSHLHLSLLAHTHIFLENPENDENSVFLDGYLCKTPVFRVTPLGRKITDLTVAINYPYLKSDYIPCICWNENALTASLFPCGSHIHAWGRIQSREYTKKLDGQDVVAKTAYEISIWKIMRNYDIS